MAEWERFIQKMVIVGPRLRDRIKIAWQILRGHNQLEYEFHVQVLRGQAEAFVDAPVCRLVISEREPDAHQPDRTEAAT